MNRFFLILPLLLLSSIYTHGQDSVVKRFPDGKLEEIRILKNGEIIKASAWHELKVERTDTIGSIEYWPKYSWNKQTKVIESYWSIEDADPLEQLFFTQCPDYTIRQYRGNGPLYYVENYKNKIRDGEYESYDETGKLIEKGQFSNWKKTGIWKYYHENGSIEWTIMTSGNYNEHGISINYIIIPILITILIILALGIFISRRFGYKTFYIYYCRGVIIYSVLFPFLARIIGQTGKYPLYILLTAMLLLSVVNTFISEQVKVKMLTSVLFATTALLLLITYYILYFLADIANAASGIILF